LTKSVRKWVSLIFWCVIAAAVVWQVLVRLPPQHNPFTDLSINHPIGFATANKVSNLQGNPDICFAFLEEADTAFTRLENTTDDENCGFADALTLDQSRFPYNATLSMTCPLTAGLMVWEEHSLIPRAREILGRDIEEIRSFGSYSCRRLYGRESGRFSEHATGNAVDIEGITFTDGSTLTLLNDWDDDSVEAEFLRAIRDDACEIFGTVLGPEYNAAHENHFHFDMSQTGICR
jgi:hypothetical protein